MMGALPLPVGERVGVRGLLRWRKISASERLTPRPLPNGERELSHSTAGKFSALSTNPVARLKSKLRYRFCFAMNDGPP